MQRLRSCRLKDETTQELTDKLGKRAAIVGASFVGLKARYSRHGAYAPPTLLRAGFREFEKMDREVVPTSPDRWERFRSLLRAWRQSKWSVRKGSCDLASVHGLWALMSWGQLGSMLKKTEGAARFGQTVIDLVERGLGGPGALVTPDQQAAFRGRAVSGTSRTVHVGCATNEWVALPMIFPDPAGSSSRPHSGAAAVEQAKQVCPNISIALRNNSVGRSILSRQIEGHAIAHLLTPQTIIDASGTKATQAGFGMHFKLIWQLEGTVRYEDAHQSFALQPGDMLITAMARTYRLEMG